MYDSTQQGFSTPTVNATHVVIHQNPIIKHGLHPTTHITIIMQLALGLIILLAIVALAVYQWYKRTKRKGHAEIMKNIKNEEEDVELSTALLREPTADTEWNTSFNNPEANVTFKGIIPKICVSTERGGFFYLLESDADAESTISNAESASSNDESTLSNDETVFLMPE